MVIPFYRFIEVALYALLNFLPPMLLALYPFRSRLRYSGFTTSMLVLALTFLQVGAGLYAAFWAGPMVSILSMVSTVVYGVFYFWAVKEPLSKTLFTLLMLSNLMNFMVVLSKCIEGQVFPDLAVQSYRWSFSLVLLVVEGTLFFPLFLYIKRVYSPAVVKETVGTEWRFLWLIPAVFYLLWYYGIYFIKDKSALEIALRPENSVFLFLINLGSCLIYYVVAKLISEESRNRELLLQNHWLKLQALQYDNLQERILQARRAKHDVRHHIVLMERLLKSHEYERLEDYLAQYNRGLPDEEPLSFCDNMTANGLLLYYAGRAKAAGVDFIVSAELPEMLHIEETDLCVVLGNILENALDGCLAMESRSKAGGRGDDRSINHTELSEESMDKRIIVRCKTDSTALYLTVDNTSSIPLKKSADGAYLSTKHSGEGLGIMSVKSIVDRYGGTMKINQKNGMVLVSVMLLS